MGPQPRMNRPTASEHTSDSPWHHGASSIQERDRIRFEETMAAREVARKKHEEMLQKELDEKIAAAKAEGVEYVKPPPPDWDKLRSSHRYINLNNWVGKITKSVMERTEHGIVPVGDINGEPSEEYKLNYGPLPPMRGDDKARDWQIKWWYEKATREGQQKREAERLAAEKLEAQKSGLTAAVRDEAGDDRAKAEQKDGVTHIKAESKPAPLKNDESVYNNAANGATTATTGQVAPHVLAASQGTRSSRFFPRTVEPTVASPDALNITDSPPPPETESHPAFAGADSGHPIVRMPKPSPRVRLPPAAAETSAIEAPVSMPSRQRPNIGARPLALNPEWQARFNSLLEKPAAGPSAVPNTKSDPKTQSPGSVLTSALAIAPSSKAPLEVRGGVQSATVSLPKKTFADDSSSEVTSRLSAEEVLLEDREFGSLPVIKTPKARHLAANEPPSTFPSSRPPPRFNPLETQSKNCLDFQPHEDGLTIRVLMGNHRLPVYRSLPRRTAKFDPKAYGHQKRNFTGNNNTSNSTSGPRVQRKASNNPRSSGTSNAWGTGRSPASQGSPSQSNNAWNKRAAAAHAAPVH